MERMVPSGDGIVSPRFSWSRSVVPLALAGFLTSLVACGSVDLDKKDVPVTEKSIGARSGVSNNGTKVPVPSVLPPVEPLPGQENAGKPGYYTVRPGDTLTRIGLDHGQSPRDLARWNGLENPNLIEVGQVLRVAAPTREVVTAANSGSGVVVTPVSKPQPAEVRAKSRPLNAAGAKPIELKPAEPTPSKSASNASSEKGGDELVFTWPSHGSILDRFDEARNKGVDLAGKAGDPVSAAADGKVVYAGSGLRGYGNLVILKHNNTYLTAYAHNKALLVKEDQAVKQGQKIAEMGDSDADRVKLHFEVRRQGKPVDPLKFLPSR